MLSACDCLLLVMLLLIILFILLQLTKHMRYCFSNISVESLGNNHLCGFMFIINWELNDCDNDLRLVFLSLILLLFLGLSPGKSSVSNIFMVDSISSSKLELPKYDANSNFFTILRSNAFCCLWRRYGHTFFTLSCHSHSTGMCRRCLFFISNVQLCVSALLVTKTISFRSLFYWVMVQILLQ